MTANEKQKRPIRAPKGIIYGPPGIGKTTFGAAPEHARIIDCENGTMAVRCDATGYLETWDEILAELRAIESGNHKYQAVTIDTLDWLLRRLEEKVAGSDGDKIDQTLNRSHGGYGNGKQVLKNHIYRVLLPCLDRIVNAGIAVILLAHAKRTDIMDADGISAEKTTADIADDYLNIFVEWSDFVCLARYTPDRKRVLVCEETPQALAKNRYGMPREVPFVWADFAGAISAGLAKKFGK